jgi:hypothetical protein
MLSMRRLALLLGFAVVACSDGVGPNGPDGGIPLQFSVGVPAAVSPAETTALQAAFDQVDSYRITVQDSVTGLVLADTTVDVGAGAEHRFDFDLSPSAVGLRIQISVIAFDGAIELYRSTAFATVQASTGGATPIYLPVRYTGPGVRGTVTNDAGVGLADMSVGLYQAASLVGAPVVTEPDGTYLFLGVAAGAYSVEPTPPQSLFVCPVGRNVDVQTNAALVADFVASSVPCEINLLVLSGGDFDNTQPVADLFANTPGVVTDQFFYVNQTPGLNLLRQYDVVLLFTNGIFDETTALGDELAEYVGVGGNVVIGSFYWQGRSDSGLTSPGWGALEAIDPFLGDIDPLTGSAGATYTANDLNGNNIVAHPLTLGLTSLVSVAGYSAGVLAKPTATVVASWTDGAPLVGYHILGAGQRVVAVSLFPAASVPTEVIGDVQVLWENAVTWAGITGGPTP